MARDDDHDSALAELLISQDGVLRVDAVMEYLTRGALRWRVSSGRWQQPCPGIVVAHSGPLTEGQVLRVAVLWAGAGAALAGLTAARLDGLSGFEDRGQRPVHLLVPASRPVRRARPALPLVVHYSRLLGPDDVHPVRVPRRTRVARSLVDAAAWAGHDRRAQAVLAAGVQQRLARPADLLAVVAANRRLARRAMISATLADIAGGAQALSELDLTRLVRRHRLPEPDRQAPRRDAAGRRRWLDAVWEAARVIVEVDGIHHIDAAEYWADMDRDIDFTLGGYRILRFPSFVVRYHGDYVAGKLRDALLAEAGLSEAVLAEAGRIEIPA
jgi:very-short-patch-repair endonuclease